MKKLAIMLQRAKPQMYYRCVIDETQANRLE